MSKINVKGTEISVITRDDSEYVSLTDMLKAKEGAFFVKSWLRNRNTLEFLAAWERLYNPGFNWIEFDLIKKNAGLNSFRLSVKEWVERTNAIGLRSTKGRNGGTYAHKDIAFEFGTWISPEFKLLLIQEYQRLKRDEADRLETGWDYRRFLAKTNYTIHTDAIKEHIIPELTPSQERLVYANEADLLNVAVFGKTAKQWKEENPKHASDGLNMRDFADVQQLTVLSNLENNNAYFISKALDQGQRLVELRKVAVAQLRSLRRSNRALGKGKGTNTLPSLTPTDSPREEGGG